MATNKLNIEEKRNADILETHSYVNARSARSNFSRLVNTARIDMERVIITEHGEPAAAIVPIKDVRLLENIPNIGWIDNISDEEFSELSLGTVKKMLRGEDLNSSMKSGGGFDEDSSKQAKRESSSSG